MELYCSTHFDHDDHFLHSDTIHEFRSKAYHGAIDAAIELITRRQHDYTILLAEITIWKRQSVINPKVRPFVAISGIPKLECQGMKPRHETRFLLRRAVNKRRAYILIQP